MAARLVSVLVIFFISTLVITVSGACSALMRIVIVVDFRRIDSIPALTGHFR